MVLMKGLQLPPMKSIYSILASMALLTAFGSEYTLDFRPKESARACVKRSVAEPTDGISRETVLSGAEAPKVDRKLMVGDRLVFRLFDDRELTLELVENTPAPMSGSAFLAETSGVAGLRSAVVVQTADGLQVDVQNLLSGMVYTISSTGDGVTVREISPVRKSCRCEAPPPLPSRGKGASVDAVESVETTRRLFANNEESAQVNVDVLVAYDTRAAAYVAGSGGNITSFAEVAVQKMNIAIANTGLDSHYRYRLVGVFAAEGDAGGGLSHVLNSIVNQGTTLNGYNWSILNDERDRFSADVVCVLVDNGTSSGTTGTGFSLDSGNIDGFDDAFNACLVRAVESGHTMTHEVGHNMGAGHSDAMADKSNCGPQLYEYSSGYYFTANGQSYYTIMAYNTDGYGNYYTAVPYFSSPDYTYDGVAVGDALHDNTRTLRETFQRVSNFRKAPFVSDEVGVGADTEGYVWETSGSYPWSLVSDNSCEGGSCARSCEMTGGTTSWVKTRVYGSATLSLNCKLRTYGGTFAISCDDEIIFSRVGEVDYGYSWNSVSVDIPAGVHEIKLAYTHPSMGFESGGNGVWIDSLSFNGGGPVTYYTVQYHRYDGSGETRDQTFTNGVSQNLLWLDSQLKWSRLGYDFIGWVPWNPDTKPRLCKYVNGQPVKDLAGGGGKADLWAGWKSSSSYRVCFHRCAGPDDMEKMNQVILRNKEDNLAWMDSMIGWKREGYTFLGWNESDKAATVKYANGAKVKNLAMDGGTKHLYAVWSARYKVRFYKYNGSGATREQSFNAGTAQNLLWMDSQLGWSRPGYEFIGWVPWNPDTKPRLCKYVNGQKVVDLASKSGETVSLWAAWKSASSYRVCFNRNDGTGVKMNQVILRNKEDTLAWMDSQIGWKREGYVFKGWAESEKGAVKYANGAKVKNLAMNGGTKQLYAIWRVAD